MQTLATQKLKTRSVLKLLAVMALALSAAPQTFAGLTAVLDTQNTGQPSGYRDPNSYGGEFTAILSGNTTFDNYVLANYSSVAKTTVGGKTGFETFCIEYNQSFTPGTSYNASVGQNAMPGGVSGSSGGNGDPVSIGTAYLYSQFAQGTLQGYNYTPGTGRELCADELQDAIWFLEGEISSGYHSGMYTFYSATSGSHTIDPFLQLVINIFGSLSAAEADANGAYGVYALNLTSSTGKYAQDQLIYCPVPEPATVGAGLMLLVPLGVSAYRLIRKKSSAA